MQHHYGINNKNNISTKTYLFIYLSYRYWQLKVESNQPILSLAYNLPQSPRQETFWASAEFEITEKSGTPCWQ